MKKIFFVLVLTMIFKVSTGQKQRLGFNLQIGQTYYNLLQSSSNVKQELNGQNITIEIGLTGKTAYKVTGLKDSIYDMDVSYEKLEMTMKREDRTITFSSESKDENDIMSKLLAQVVGKPFNIKMTKSGKIIEVKNVDLIFDNMFDQFPDISAAQKEQVKAQLMQIYGEKAFKGSFEMVTYIFPDLPVKKGDSWVINTKLESSMLANLVITYEFKDKTDRYNLILGNGKFATSDNADYVEISGMPTRYKLEGDVISSLKIDSKTGWIIEATINQKMSGIADIKDNPKLPGGLTIPMSFENIMNIRSN